MIDKVYCKEDERRASREAGWEWQLAAHHWCRRLTAPFHQVLSFLVAESRTNIADTRCNDFAQDLTHNYATLSC